MRHHKKPQNISQFEENDCQRINAKTTFLDSKYRIWIGLLFSTYPKAWVMIIENIEHNRKINLNQLCFTRHKNECLVRYNIVLNEVTFQTAYVKFLYFIYAIFCVYLLIDAWMKVNYKQTKWTLKMCGYTIDHKNLYNLVWSPSHFIKESKIKIELANLPIERFDVCCSEKLDVENIICQNQIIKHFFFPARNKFRRRVNLLVDLLLKQKLRSIQKNVVCFFKFNW